jgi:hypothetical protein
MIYMKRANRPSKRLPAPVEMDSWLAAAAFVAVLAEEALWVAELEVEVPELEEPELVELELEEEVLLPELEAPELVVVNVTVVAVGVVISHNDPLWNITKASLRRGLTARGWAGGRRSSERRRGSRGAHRDDDELTRLGEDAGVLRAVGLQVDLIALAVEEVSDNPL